MRLLQCHLVLLLVTWLGPVTSLAAQSGSHAHGGGTYSPTGTGFLSEFQFNEAHVQCKIAHGVLPDGTAIQMFMDSTSINSVSVTGNTAVITGQMTSVVRLHPPGGGTVTLSESVPFNLNAQDNGGVGKDFFGLTVTYNPNAPGPGGLNQYKFFGATPANPTTTFSGVLLTGNITVD
jgi:hypothetical protein